MQVEVGTLPAGKKQIKVRLSSPNDVDLRLYLKSSPNTMRVGWPNGVISGSKAQSMVQQGSTIIWSGYNGEVDKSTGLQKPGDFSHQRPATTAQSLAVTIIEFVFW